MMKDYKDLTQTEKTELQQLSYEDLTEDRKVQFCQYCYERYESDDYLATSRAVSDLSIQLKCHRSINRVYLSNAEDLMLQTVSSMLEQCAEALALMYHKC